MTSSPLDPTFLARLSPVWRVDFQLAPAQSAKQEQTKTVASELQDQREEAQQEQPSGYTPNQLLVRVDVEASRFVQTLKDGATDEVVWSYPNEAQLEFSRAIGAYLKASSRS